MPKQNNKQDVEIVNRHFNVASFLGVLFMVAYAIYEKMAGFTAPFAEMQTRAFAIMALPVVIMVLADRNRIGRVFGDRN